VTLKEEIDDQKREKKWFKVA